MAWIAALVVLMGTAAALAQTVEPVGSASGILTATVRITAAGTSASTTATALPVLTQGVAGLDFNLAAGGTCAASTPYAVGDTCTVNYTFTPMHPWVRYGGIEVVTDAGMVLGNSFIYGTGNGPQAAFSVSTPTTPVTLGGGFHEPTGLALDAGGNIFVADLNDNTVYEIPAAGGYTTIKTLGGGFDGPSTVAIDGSGNIYIANANDETVSEMPPGCVSAACVVKLGGGFTRPAGIAVDGNGNVYVADYNNQAVTEMPPNCFSTSCMTNLGAGFRNPRDVAVDGNGNVYVVDPVNVALTRMPAGCTKLSCVTILGGGFNYPQGVAVDGAGNVYVADQNATA
jgi:large repetitive protein